MHPFQSRPRILILLTPVREPNRMANSLLAVRQWNGVATSALCAALNWRAFGFAHDIRSAGCFVPGFQEFHRGTSLFAGALRGFPGLFIGFPCLLVLRL